MNRLIDADLHFGMHRAHPGQRCPSGVGVTVVAAWCGAHMESFDGAGMEPVKQRSAVSAANVTSAAGAVNAMGRYVPLHFFDKGGAQR